MPGKLKPVPQPSRQRFPYKKEAARIIGSLHPFNRLRAPGEGLSIGREAMPDRKTGNPRKRIPCSQNGPGNGGCASQRRLIPPEELPPRSGLLSVLITKVSKYPRQ